MNPNPPSQTRLPFRRPPPRRATARRGRPGGLPRFTTGSARDAINLRWNYTNEINLATGEWTRAGYRAPACYVTNAWSIIRATFSAAPADLSSVTLLADTDAAIGGFAVTNVSFSNGAASNVVLSTRSATTNCVLKETFDLTWKAVFSNEIEIVTNTLGKTDGHVFYTILDEPKLPWMDSVITNQNIWASALDFLSQTNVCGAATFKTNALARLTEYLFGGHLLRYDRVQGDCKYFHFPDPSVANSHHWFDASGYMVRNKGNVVNCYDQAYGVSLFGKLLGIESDVVFLEPFGFINETRIVGIGRSNSPFYTSGPLATATIRESNDTDRAWFLNHRYVIRNDMVFDACAGPALGTQTHQQYLDCSVDTSTPDERDLTDFQSDPRVAGKRAGDIGNTTNDTFLVEIQ